MKWEKLGQLFVSEQHFEWMHSHAANPFAVRTPQEGLFRIYFTCRNVQNQSHIGLVDIDFLNNFKITHLSPEPVVAPGQLGIFDDSGVAMGYYIEIDQVPHIYYLGWNLKVTVPWLNTIGLAKLNTNTQKFEKVSFAPILDRSHEDPFTISYPSILYEEGKYRMWYGSNLKWGKDQNEMNHVFKYAESIDGIHWHRSGKIVLNLQYPQEYALSKPYVIKEGDGAYKMWYSYRASPKGETYRIGYAESPDGINWTRKDEEVGIEVSESGWDSEMVCYPYIFDFQGNRYMLYNGNGYGKTGFGLAIQKS